MKKVFLLILTTLFIRVASAQTPIGHYHDWDGFPLHGYYDALSYSPLNALSITHFSDSFEKGKLYLRNGSTKKGLIKFENRKVWFKVGDEKRTKIKTEELVGLTIGIDSFFVANDFHVERKTGSSLQSEADFLQYLTTINGYTFAKHYHFSSGMAVNYAWASSVIETYQVLNPGASSWRSFPRSRKKFKEMALPYFKHVPALKEKIESEVLGYENMMTLIKMTEYYDHYQRNEPLYFNAHWQEVAPTDEWVYRAHVTQLEDSTWTIEYDKNDIKICSGQFSSLYPNKKEGLFVNYYPDGTGRDLSIYENNELVTASTFHPNGVLHYEYEVISTFNGFEEIKFIDYLEAKTDKNQTLSKMEGKWSETFEDPITGNTFINEFDGPELRRAYRMDGDRKIYQLTDPYYKLKFNALQTKLSNYVQGMEWREAAQDQAQGTLFIAVIIDEKGTVDAYKLLNSIHPELDDKIKKWAVTHLRKEATYRFRFRPYKIGKEKVFAEFVIPIRFSINKFYRAPASNYYDWGWHHHMMFQQQQQFTPPPMPTRF